MSKGHAKLNLPDLLRMKSYRHALIATFALSALFIEEIAIGSCRNTHLQMSSNQICVNSSAKHYGFRNQGLRPPVHRRSYTTLIALFGISCAKPCVDNRDTFTSCHVISMQHQLC